MLPDMSALPLMSKLVASISPVEVIAPPLIGPGKLAPEVFIVVWYPVFA